MSCQQLMIEGEVDEFDGAVTVQFAQHVGTMDMHRFMAEIEFESDFLNAVTFDQ